jgi:hypothetical protein
VERKRGGEGEVERGLTIAYHSKNVLFRHSASPPLHLFQRLPGGAGWAGWGRQGGVHYCPVEFLSSGEVERGCEEVCSCGQLSLSPPTFRKRSEVVRSRASLCLRGVVQVFGTLQTC